MIKKPSNLRKQMESSVIAVNKYLKDVVGEMKEHELFSNMHPYDAEYFGKTVRSEEKFSNFGR